MYNPSLIIDNLEKRIGLYNQILIIHDPSLIIYDIGNVVAIMTICFNNDWLCVTAPTLTIIVVVTSVPR
jgi:hypothetical protein